MTPHPFGIQESQLESRHRHSPRAAGMPPSDIVVYTDFTRESGEAIDAATSLAQRFHSGLWVVHNINNALGALPQRARDAALSRIREMLDEEADRVSRKGVAAQTVLIGGGSQNRLADAIGERKIGLVVVSKPSLPAQWSWLMGAAADKVATNMRVPVLQIHGAVPFVTWGELGRPLRIMVGVDLPPASDTALQWAAGLAEAGPCEVMAVHIKPDFAPPKRPDLETQMDAETRPAEPCFQSTDLNARVRGMPVNVAAQIRILEHPGWGSIANHLIHLAREHQTDLLVIGNKENERSDPLNPPVSQVVLRRASTNVACVPLAAEFAQLESVLSERASGAPPPATSATNPETS